MVAIWAGSKDPTGDMVPAVTLTKASVACWLPRMAAKSGAAPPRPVNGSRLRRVPVEGPVDTILSSEIDPISGELKAELPPAPPRDADIG